VEDKLKKSFTTFELKKLLLSVTVFFTLFLIVMVEYYFKRQQQIPINFFALIFFFSTFLQNAFIKPVHIYSLSPLYDYFFGVPIGFFAIIYSILFFLVKAREEFLLRNNFVARAGIFSLVLLIKNIAFTVLYYLVYKRFFWEENLVGSMFFTLLIYPVIYKTLLILFEKYGRKYA
jgi:uncharacterized membrane protein